MLEWRSGPDLQRERRRDDGLHHGDVLEIATVGSARREADERQLRRQIFCRQIAAAGRRRAAFQQIVREELEVRA